MYTNKINETNKQVLIVEDWKALARALKALLEASGHNVTWLVGARSFELVEGGAIVEGLKADGSTEKVDCRQFKLAFVDGQIEGEIQGPAMVELLSLSHVACCGMSTSSEINREMLENGASIAAKKPVIFSAILSRQLTPNNLIGPSAVHRTRLAALEARFTRDDCRGLRHEAEIYLAPFLAEDR